MANASTPPPDSTTSPPTSIPRPEPNFTSTTTATSNPPAKTTAPPRPNPPPNVPNANTPTATPPIAQLPPTTTTTTTIPTPTPVAGSVAGTNTNPPPPPTTTQDANPNKETRQQNSSAPPSPTRSSSTPTPTAAATTTTTNIPASEGTRSENPSPTTRNPGSGRAHWRSKRSATRTDPSQFKPIFGLDGMGDDTPLGSREQSSVSPSEDGGGDASINTEEQGPPNLERLEGQGVKGRSSSATKTPAQDEISPSESESDGTSDIEKPLKATPVSSSKVSMGKPGFNSGSGHSKTGSGDDSDNEMLSSLLNRPAKRASKHGKTTKELVSKRRKVVSKELVSNSDSDGDASDIVGEKHGTSVGALEGNESGKPTKSRGFWANSGDDTSMGDQSNLEDPSSAAQSPSANQSNGTDSSRARRKRSAPRDEEQSEGEDRSGEEEENGGSYSSSSDSEGETVKTPGNRSKLQGKKKTPIPSKQTKKHKGNTSSPESSIIGGSVSEGEEKGDEGDEGEEGENDLKEPKNGSLGPGPRPEAVFSRDERDLIHRWAAHTVNPWPELPPGTPKHLVATLEAARTLENMTVGRVNGKPKLKSAMFGWVHKGSKTHRALLWTMEKYIEMHGTQEIILPTNDEVTLRKSLFALVTNTPTQGATVLNWLKRNGITPATYAERVVVKEPGRLYGQYGLVARKFIPAQTVLGVYGGQYFVDSEHKRRTCAFNGFGRRDEYALVLTPPEDFTAKFGILHVDPFPMRHKDPHTAKYGNCLLMYMNDCRENPMEYARLWDEWLDGLSGEELKLVTVEQKEVREEQLLTEEERERCNVRLYEMDYYGWPVKVAVATKDIHPNRWLLSNFGAGYWSDQRANEDFNQEFMHTVVDMMQTEVVQLGQSLRTLLAGGDK